VADHPRTGRRIVIVAVIDAFTKASLTTVPHTSITYRRGNMRDCLEDGGGERINIWDKVLE
jgi:hypothetical protein